MLDPETLKQNFLDYARDKATRNILEDYIQFKKFDQRQSYICNESGMVIPSNETEREELFVDYLGSDPKRYNKLTEE